MCGSDETEKRSAVTVREEGEQRKCGTERLDEQGLKSKAGFKDESSEFCLRPLKGNSCFWEPEGFSHVFVFRFGKTQTLARTVS